MGVCLSTLDGVLLIATVPSNMTQSEVSGELRIDWMGVVIDMLLAMRKLCRDLVVFWRPFGSMKEFGTGLALLTVFWFVRGR